MKSIIRKVLRFSDYLLKRIIAYSLFFLIKLSDKYYKIRFIFVDDGRIGALAGNIETHLRKKVLTQKESCDIFVFGNPCNDFYVELLTRKHKVICSRFLKSIIGIDPLKSAYTIYPEAFNMKYLMRGYSHQSYPHNLRDLIDPVLSFSDADKARGQEILREMGVPSSSWYVCFHARDDLYLDTVEKLPPGYFSYHNYRDCSVNNYLSSARAMTKAGGFALRMGHWVKGEIPNERGIIDYSREYRSDFGDIYLPAHAKFFIGNTAGIINASSIFNVPIAIANHVPLAHCIDSEFDLFIPKKIWSTEEKRFLSFREILESGVGGYFRSEEYVESGLEPVENTADEIEALVVEMNQRIDGTWHETDEDLDLQGQYHSLFEQSSVVTPFSGRSKIGAYFLRDNRDLLLR